MKMQVSAKARAGAALVGAAALLGLVVLRVTAAPKVPVVQAAEGSAQRKVHGPGTLRARIAVTVSARVTGVVREVLADLGDRVTEGQLLATLDDSESGAREAAMRERLAVARQNVAVAQSALAKTHAEAELARTNHQRDAEIFQKGHISQAAMDAARVTVEVAKAAEANAAAALAARQAEVRAAEQELASTQAVRSYGRIAAPMNGVIVSREAEVGDTAQPGFPLFRMVDPDTLWIVARIDESVAGDVRVGQPAAIRLRTGATLQGEVARLALESDPVTRELEVHVAFQSPPERFALGQEAEVEIDVGARSGVLVPASSLVQQGGARGVLVVADGRAELRVVRATIASGETVVIDDGLRAGEWVVREPGKVKPRARVRPVPPGGEP